MNMTQIGYPRTSTLSAICKIAIITVICLWSSLEAKTASGVTKIAVMLKPYAFCPHGRCRYVPVGLEFNTPLSYTGTEPATKVAQRFSYDAYEQARSKMEQLQSRGHDVARLR